MRVVVTLALLLCAACGARTGLRVTDGGASPDAGVRDLGPRDFGVRDLGGTTDLGAADLGGVAATLDGLRWELPCAEPRYSNHICTTDASRGTSTTLAGIPGERYDVTLRFRGVVEEKTYLGGTTDGHWNEGGVPSMATDDSWNVYSFLVSDPPLHAYVNAGMSGGYACVPVDFMRTVRVAAGARVTLEAASLNDLQVENVDASGAPIVVPGVPPAPSTYDGQFVQVDVISVVRAP